MTRDHIHNVFVRIISDRLDIEEDEVDMSKSLEELGGDSLDSLEILLLTEEEFGVDVTDASAENSSASLMEMEDAIAEYIAAAGE